MVSPTTARIGKLTEGVTANSVSRPSMLMPSTIAGCICPNSGRIGDPAGNDLPTNSSVCGTR
ncbi:hypothetical protein D3C76_694920 [compost metagenome]